MVTSVGCGKCRFCKAGRENICAKTEALGYFYPGGFAEYIKIPAESVAQNTIIKLPVSVSFEEGKVDAKKFVTHKLPLEKITEGLNLAREGKTLKVVILP